MDFFFIIAMALAIDHAMKKHGGWKDGMGGLGGFIGLCIAGAIGIALIRIPVYLCLYGFRFPFEPSSTVAFLTGIGAIIFWWAMIWWQVPARLLGHKVMVHKEDTHNLPDIDGQCDDCMYRRFSHDETPCSHCTENPVKVRPDATNSWQKWEGLN